MLARFSAVRAATEELCAPLQTEDYVVQSMSDVSPTKWHLAHTTWFWETFLLKPNFAGYQEINPDYAFLFNSYYVQAGERHCRAQRGYISRPTVAEVFDYRHAVDSAMHQFLSRIDDNDAEIIERIELGLNHEQQHQELMLTDIKHVFSVNPLRPVYRPRTESAARISTRQTSRWLKIEGGLHQVGHSGSYFAFDNESPRHQVYIEPFEIASLPVTNAEYIEFINAGEYQRAEHWLSLGWAEVQANQWSAPFYWEKRGDEWLTFTLNGMQPLDPNEPVCHISYFEADAFARWKSCRLPTEAEWEIAANGLKVDGNFVENGAYHPVAAANAGLGLQKMFGDVWEWTQSPYNAYPGFKPAAGALGEYNGKFMCNQFVLRGGSCATPISHIRSTYRNFFPPEATWQFTGFRLARDV